MIKTKKYNTYTLTAVAAGIILSFIIILTNPVVLLVNDGDKFMDDYRQTVKQSKYISHALGGADGRTYLNNIQVAESKYEEGVRLFEVDISWTSDKKLVLSHGWTKKDQEDRLGIPYDRLNPIPTYDDFMSYKFHGKYEPADFSDLVGFMQQHYDVYVMIDTGGISDQEVKDMYTQIVNQTDDDGVLERVIAGGRTTGSIRAVKDVYDFRLYNLYYADDSLREDQINTPEDFIEHCLTNGISSMSIAKDRYTDDIADAFNDSSIFTYVFTINNDDELKEAIDQGASIVGTDFLR